MAELECFFDCSSPWTYFAFENLLLMQRKSASPSSGARSWSVACSTRSASQRPRRSRKAGPGQGGLQQEGPAGLGQNLGLPIHYRPSVFPVTASRRCGLASSWSRKASWSRGRAKPSRPTGSITRTSQAPVLSEICRKVDVDLVRLLAAIDQQPIKDLLRSTTQELMDRGGFGSPTISVGGDDMYFGNDRMPLIKDAGPRRRVTPASSQPPSSWCARRSKRHRPGGRMAPLPILDLKTTLIR